MKAATLLYHDVVEAGKNSSSGFRGAGPDRYKLELNEFLDHLRALDHDVGRAPTSVANLANGTALPWLLTFDDGGSSAVQRADTRREGRPGHFFITVDFVGTDSFVSADDVRALDEMGHVLGSHSCSHPERMAHCSRSQLEDEWRRSVKVLAEILGRPVVTASVPGGDYNEKVAETAAAAGIGQLFTSEPVFAFVMLRAARSSADLQSSDTCPHSEPWSLLRGGAHRCGANTRRGRPRRQSRRSVVATTSSFGDWFSRSIASRHYVSSGAPAPTWARASRCNTAAAPASETTIPPKISVQPAHPSAPSRSPASR
jgi:hypothetical protein